MIRRLSILRLPQRLASEQRGVALIEFAITLPILVLLFLGGYQLMDAISVYRKVGVTARTLADLTTQNSTITATQADEILSASTQVMAPYAASGASLRISQIQVDALYQVKVSWSRGANATAYAAGSNFTGLPAYLLQPNRYYIFSEMSYNYVPKIAQTFIGTVPLSQTIYMSPRNSAFIAYN